MRSDGQICFSITVAVLCFLATTEGYILTRCDEFGTDIENGLADFLTSVRAARSSITVEYGNEVVDWFSLLDSLYPELKETPDLLNKLRCAYTLALNFSPAAILGSTFQARVKH